MIIDFKKKENDRVYLEQLKAAADELSDISVKLFGLGLNLAISGKWKEWNDSVAIGSEVCFDDDMLLDTGDEFVTRIIRMKLEIDNLTADIDRKGE